MLFFTGFTRSASKVLADQKYKTEQKNREIIDNLHFIQELGYKSKVALESGDIHEFGKIMNSHWDYKKKRTSVMSNSYIDNVYELAIKNGAIGGKLVGAGGGGFLLFIAKDKRMLCETMKRIGLEQVRFNFDFEGCKIIHSS